MSNHLDRRAFVRDLRQLIANARPYTLAEAPHANRLSIMEREILESHLRERFELWAEICLTPRLDELEAYWRKGGKRAREK